MPNRTYKVPRRPKTASGRTKTTKKGKSLSSIKKKLWELCKQLTRLKYGNTCYTCSKTNLEGSSWHTGHFIPSSTCGIFLRYNLRNLRPQCYFCNINLGGNGSAFYRNMVGCEGQEYVDQLFRDKQKITKGDLFFYQELVDKYQKILDDMV